jgi:hypothetical protein
MLMSQSCSFGQFGRVRGAAALKAQAIEDAVIRRFRLAIAHAEEHLVVLRHGHAHEGQIMHDQMLAMKRHRRFAGETHAPRLLRPDDNRRLGIVPRPSNVNRASFHAAPASTSWSPGFSLPDNARTSTAARTTCTSPPPNSAASIFASRGSIVALKIEPQRLRQLGRHHARAPQA